jgi:hypothetical protein
VKAAKKEERSVAPERPDIEITARVKARELRFDEVPETEVHPPAQTKRENLPEEVRPEHAGITFRNVSVQLRIANELTANEPDRWEESKKEGEAERLMRNMTRVTRVKEQERGNSQERRDSD